MSAWFDTFTCCNGGSGGSSSVSGAGFSVVIDEPNRLSQSGLQIGHRTFQNDTGVIWTLVAAPASNNANWQPNASGTPSPRQGEVNTLASLPSDDTGLDRILVLSNLLWYRWDGAAWDPDFFLSSGTAAERIALTEMIDGQVFWQTNDDTKWIYNGASWQQQVVTTSPRQGVVANIAALPANDLAFDRIRVTSNRLWYRWTGSAWEIETYLTSGTAAQRTALTQHVDGQVFFQTDDDTKWISNGSIWTQMVTTASPRQGNITNIAALPANDTNFDRLFVLSNFLYYRWTGVVWKPESLLSTGTAAERGILTEELDGQRFFQTDNDTEWVSDGTNWTQILSSTSPRQGIVDDLGLLPATGVLFDREYVRSNRLSYRRNQADDDWDVDDDLIAYVPSLSTLALLTEMEEGQGVYVAGDGDIWRWTDENGWHKILD